MYVDLEVTSKVSFRAWYKQITMCWYSLVIITQNFVLLKSLDNFLDKSLNFCVHLGISLDKEKTTVFVGKAVALDLRSRCHFVERERG